ncbi:hypothetical protein THOM_1897 [Trachipleistophora hominis]|uniref:Uncharacterized protein n=1 Tax=Trachipleistophora hominis TaxID=72359 RepID=L7JVX7_TRAHO|nr:hypothetical protein THOM_1897 [Trachipleistophora hominis]
MKKSAHIYTFYGIAVVVLLLVLYVFVHKKAVYNPVVEMKRSAMLDELEEEKKKKEEKQKDEEQWKDGDRKDAEKENTERAGNMDGGISTPYGGMAARDMYTNMYGVPPASTPANEYYYPGTGSLPQNDPYTAVQPQFNNTYTGPIGPPTNDSNGQMSKEAEEMLDSLVQDPMFNLTMFMGMLNRIKDENKDGADEDDSKSYVRSRFVPPTLITLPGRYNLGLRRPGESIFGENVGSQLGVDSFSTGTGGPLGSSYENMPGARVPDTGSENASESLGQSLFGEDKKKKDEKSVVPSMFADMGVLGGDGKDKKEEENVSPSFTGITVLGNDKDKKKEESVSPSFTGITVLGNDKDKKKEESVSPSFTGITALGNDKDKKKDNKDILPPPFTDTSSDSERDDGKRKGSDDAMFLPLDGTPAMDRNGGEKPNDSAVSSIFGVVHTSDDKKDKKKKDENSILPSLTGTSALGKDDKDKDKKKKDEKSVLPSPFSDMSILNKDEDDKKKKDKKKDEKSILPSPFFNTSILDKDKDEKKKKKDEKSILPSPFFNTSILDKDKDEKKKKKDENNTLPFSIFGTKHSQTESNNRNETSPSSQDRMSGTGTKASDRTDSSTKESNVPMASNDKTKDKKQKKDEQPVVDRVVKQAIFVAIGSSGNDKGRGVSGDSGMNGALRNGTTNSSIGDSSNNGKSDRTSTDTMNRSVPPQNGHEGPAEQDLLNFSILDNNRDSSSPSADSNLPKDSLQEKTPNRKQKDEGRTDKKFLDSYDLFSSIDDAKKDKRDSTETVGDKYDVPGEVPVKSDTLLTNGGIIKPENSLSTGNEPEGSSGQPSKSQKTGNLSNKNRISANYTESTPIFRDLPTYTNKNKKSKPRSKQVVPIIKFKELKDEMDGMDRLIDEVKDIREMKERSFDDMLGSIVSGGKGPEDKKENGSDKSEAFDLGEKLAFRKVPSTNTSSDAPAVVVTPEHPTVNQEKNPEVTLTAIPKKRVHRRIKHKSHKKRKNAPPKKSEPVVNEQGFFDFFMPGTNTEGDNKDQGERTSHKHHKGKKKHKVSQEISNDSTPGDEHVLVANGYQKALKGDTLRTGQEKVKRETTSRNIVEINSDDYGKEMVS